MSVIPMGKLLYEVRGGSQGQAISKSEITSSADAILQPLMDLLDGKLQSKNVQWLSEQMKCENLQIGKTAVVLWIPMTQK